MEPTGSTRRLSAILMADVVGYSRLMGQDEEETVRRLKAHRQVFSGHISKSRGRIVNAPGDSILAEFTSVVDAVGTAVEIQRELAERNSALPDDQRMHYRIGINLGDVIVDEDAIYGDGVNVAARLESLAEPGGICISGSVHTSVENKLPLSYEFLGDQQVKNIAKPVPTYKVLSQPGAAAHRATRAFHLGMRKGKIIGFTAAAAIVAAFIAVGVYYMQPPPEDPILAMPTGPTIAVLAFENMSGDPEQEYFSDGITEEIITELSRRSNLFVIARNSSFQYKGQSVDVRQIGRELGARYVLEGSVRKAGGTIRVTVQRLDAGDGTHLWAETYDRELTGENLFDVQDQITESVVGAIGGQYGAIHRAGLKASRVKAPGSLDAYDCVMQAIYYIRQILPNLHRSARDCLEIAMEKEPDYAEGWAWLAELYLDEYAFGFNPRPDPLKRGLEAAQRAVRLDPSSQVAQEMLAYAYYFMKKDSFFAKADQAIAINPNNPDALGNIGINLAWAGQWERGIALCHKAIALNPNFPGWIYLPLSYYAYKQQDYAAAMKWAEKVELPGFFWNYYALAISYGQLGMQDEAKQAVAQLLEAYPGFDQVARRELHKFFWEDEVIEHQIEGLRKAGLEVPDEA